MLTLNLVDLRDVRIEPVTWLVTDRLPLGEVTVVEGKGGVGKTTMMLDIAARLSCGRAMPDGTPTQPATVLIIAEEDRQTIIKARLLAAGADLSRVHLVVSVGDDENFFVLPKHGPALLQAIRETGAQLVIIDSLFSHFQSELDAKNSQEVRRVLRPLVNAAHDTGAAIVGIRHWTKGAAVASDRGLGSADIRNVARSVLTVGEHPDDEGCFAVAVSKSNLGKPCEALTYRLESVTVEEDRERVDVARVAWGERAAITADELTNRAPPSTEDASDRAAVEDWLCEYLAGEQPSREVLAEGKRAGFSRASIYRAAKRLGVVKNPRDGFGGRSTWSPPVGFPCASQSSHISQVPETETTGIYGETSDTSAEEVLSV